MRLEVQTENVLVTLLVPWGFASWGFYKRHTDLKVVSQEQAIKRTWNGMAGPVRFIVTRRYQTASQDRTIWGSESNKARVYELRHII